MIEMQKTVAFGNAPFISKSKRKTRFESWRSS